MGDTGVDGVGAFKGTDTYKPALNQGVNLRRTDIEAWTARSRYEVEGASFHATKPACVQYWDPWA